MAQTTTAINACDAKIELDNGGGGLVDISGSSNECNIDLDNNLGEYKTFGTDFLGRLECGKDASIMLRVIYSQSDAEGLTMLREWYFNEHGNRTFRISLPDGNEGSDRFTFEVFLEKLSIPAKSDEAAPIMVQADMKPTGAFSVAVIGS